ncbi:glucose-6-phosphate isomerase [Haloferax namakaokahaiae]|uniref:Probable glucose-6-phosphate isomerase n=1 Tax=Haloferax namakaokahaiae TaxID=1748331 RepID=A0ABD5ZBX8_9EURY
MQIDLGNVLDTASVHGVSRETLERLDDRVAAAHDRIERGRETDEHGYASLNLPSSTDPAEIREAVGGFENPSAIVTVGIGGSALGAATLTDALDSDVEAHYLDNVDPEAVASLLDSLDLGSTVVNVVSRSGTTAETLANFLVVQEAMDDAGVDWADRTFVTTGEEGNLRDLANQHDLPVLPVPDGVPGRFSVLSTVGLAAAALCGHDIEAVLEGAAAQEARLSDSLFDSPAYAYGAVCFALAERGYTANAMMPYAESLETFSEWFAQLWAESLGKDGLGQTPLRALGATDQHSQLQLYRAGPRDKLVTLVRATDREDVSIPETDLDGLAYLGGSSLGELLDAEFEATEASLVAAGQPNVRIELDEVNEYGLGELLYAMETACVVYGELASVETFVQPAVEWGKRAARGLLGGGDFEEADAVADKERLIID